MNIFAVSPDPYECALALDDVRLRKMIVESAQLLSTALHVWGRPEAADVYKPTHTNHPCALWVQESWKHYAWLAGLLDHYLVEYMSRTGKKHQTFDVMITLVLAEPPYIAQRDAALPNCTPYPDMDTHTAYRVLLREKWAADAENGRPPKWTNRGAPEWAKGVWMAGKGLNSCSNMLTLGKL